MQTLLKGCCISIEIMLLAITLLVLLSSFGFDDNAGQVFSLYIIAIAGAESVIGLSILVAYFRFIYILGSEIVFIIFCFGLKILESLLSYF